jgi:TetR/AcrR family transcriptional repressor of nem operon
MKAKQESGVMRIGARERVLEAARSIIDAQGFKNASLNDILAAAAVSTSNFYYHFKSKEDLGLAVVKQFTEGVEEHLIKGLLLDRTRTPLVRLRGYLEIHQRKLESAGCTRGCPIGKLSGELSDSHPCFRAEIERVFGRLRESLRECIREGIECGELRRGIDPANASSLFLGSVQGLVLLAKSEKTSATFAQGAEELLRLLVEPR